MSVPMLQETPVLQETMRPTAPHHQKAVLATAASSDLEPALRLFLDERTRLFRIAYRMIGDTAYAEDVVQEAWLRWQHANHHEIRNPAAFLTTTTSRLAINLIQSAHHRRETPAEPLPPEPVDITPSPEREAERNAAADDIMKLLLSRLSPSERGAYVLRKGFDYPYSDIARVLGISTANARRLVHRAQEHLTNGPQRRVDSHAHQQLAQAFQAAARHGELSDLETLLAQAMVTSRPAARTARGLNNSVWHDDAAFDIDRPPSARAA
jgi:RNA polymerase sigma factor (sigma-70 family)